MRVLLVTPLYPPDLGDLAVYAKEFAEQLRKTDHVTIATYGELKRLPTIVRLVVFTFRLWKAAKNTDILYVSDGASVGLPAVIVSFLRNVPMVRFIIQDEAWERAFHAKAATTDEATFILSVPSGRLAWIKCLQRFVLHSAKWVFVPSAFYQTLFKKGYGITSEVLTYPANTPLELPFSPEPIEHQLLSTQYLERDSGFEQAFAAIAELRANFSDIKLVIANAGREQRHYQRLTQTLGIEKHVVFLGHVSRAEQEDLARNSSAQLILKMDNAGIRSLHDAYAQGVAVITNESSDLTANIQLLFTDPFYKAKLIENGERFVTEQASWESHLAGWQTAIKKIL